VLSELHKMLVAPIAAALEGAAEVLIIPHGDLLTVPWAALLDESRAEQHRYLIQRHVVRVAPSLRVARAAAHAVALRSPERPRRALVVGNPLPTELKPLPFAEMEAEEVAEVEAEEVAKAPAGSGAGSLVVLMGEEASTSRVLEGMQGADHVHYAGHATPKTLLLANREELWMTQVQEEVKLARGATVVLSGCETLLGRVRPEGSVGVARAFLLAGAGSVVASLWNVDDMATKELMCDFYKELYGSGGRGRGVRAAEAIRRAMLARIHERKCPSLWAAFLVNGA
jgi:CHAT domain-containing protein